MKHSFMQYGFNMLVPAVIQELKVEIGCKMKECRIFVACFLCTSAAFGASLDVWTGALDSKTFSTNNTDATTTEFTESGLAVPTTVYDRL